MLQDLALDVLLRGDHPALWDIYCQRETLRFLRKRGNALGTRQFDELLAEILKGPPRERYRDDLSEDQWHERRDHQIRIRLSKLVQSGAILPDEARNRLVEINKQIPWEPEGDGSEEFPVFITSRSGGWEEAGSPRDFGAMSQADFIEWAESLSERVWDCGDGWAGYVEANPSGALSLLEGCVQSSKWPPHPWYTLLDTFERSETIPKKLKVSATRALSLAPPESLNEIELRAARWLEHVLKITPKRVMRRLWRNLWEAASVMADPEEAPNVDLALNHPGGVLGDVLYKEMAEYIPLAPEGVHPGLPRSLRPAFQLVGEQQHVTAQLARISLAPMLYILNRIDPDWTTRYLVRRMDSDADDFEPHLWEGFLWNARWAPDLISEIKPALLKVLRRIELVPERMQDHAVQLFIAISIPPERMVTRDEARGVLFGLGPDELADAAWAMKDILSAAGAKSPELWQHTMGPWFEFAWPMRPCDRSPKLSENLTWMAIDSGDAFPDVVAAIANCLVGEEWFGALYHLEKSEQEKQVVTRYPDAALILMNGIVGDKARIPDEIATPILNAICNAKPALRHDAIFQSLSGKVGN